MPWAAKLDMAVLKFKDKNKGTDQKGSDIHHKKKVTLPFF